MNLARWLLRNCEAAEDSVREATLRACHGFGSFHGDDARVWFLRIVHHACYTRMNKNGSSGRAIKFGEAPRPSGGPNGENLAPRSDQQRLIVVLESLPPLSRGVLALRELEGCSYRQIAEITQLPLDRVLSTLYGARQHVLQKSAPPSAKASSGNL